MLTGSSSAFYYGRYEVNPTHVENTPEAADRRNAARRRKPIQVIGGLNGCVMQHLTRSATVEKSDAVNRSTRHVFGLNSSLLADESAADIRELSLIAIIISVGMLPLSNVTMRPEKCVGSERCQVLTEPLRARKTRRIKKV